jgi:hypothetical protein
VKQWLWIVMKMFLPSQVPLTGSKVFQKSYELCISELWASTRIFREPSLWLDQYKQKYKTDSSREQNTHGRSYRDYPSLSWILKSQLVLVPWLHVFSARGLLHGYSIVVL